MKNTFQIIAFCFALSMVSSCAVHVYKHEPVPPGRYRPPPVHIHYDAEPLIHEIISVGVCHLVLLAVSAILHDRRAYHPGSCR